MSDLVVIVPSRGRPQAAREVAEAFAQTCTADTALLVVADTDDPTVDGYRDIEPRLAHVTIADHRSMVDALNRHANGFANLGRNIRPFALGFMGDDHRPRTVGWDTRYLDALRELGTGMVYGDDLLQREALPTQIAMTTDIVRTLGYMSPPTLTHLYVDNSWLRWGTGLGRLRYLPDVVVEHCHPLARKSDWDAGYARVNSSAMYDRDARAFDEYCRSGLDGDLAKLRAVVGV